MDASVGHGPEIPYIKEIVVFLVSAVLVVPLFQRLRVSPILGYLAIGALIGPHGLGVIDDVEGVQRLAELGVVFLLFTVGLELSVERLWAMRRSVFGLGMAQVVVTGIIIGLVAWGWGNSTEAAIVLGACLALSSTAVVMQLLIERGELGSRAGRTCFSILLFQDLAVVPILFAVTVFGQSSEGSVLTDLGVVALKALGAVAAIMIAGRLLLRPLFKLVSGTRSPELFTGMILLAILGTAFGTGVAGLSMALGAFLAGLLLAETEFRHQVETDIAPFKGLLLGLFFISVGMAIDFGQVADKAFWLALSVVGLIVLKAVIAIGLCLLFGVPRGAAVEAGLLLGQAGEFAFVVVGAAVAVGLMPDPVGQFMLIVASLSLVVTPFLAILARRAGAMITSSEASGTLSPGPEDDEALEGHVLIAGYGRVGRTVARLLEVQTVQYVALDINAARVTEARKRGVPAFYGNASRREVLERLGARRAAAIVITLDDPTASAQAVASIRQAWPELKIYVRSRDVQHTTELIAAGATEAVPEAIESSLQLAGQVLQALGTPLDAVNLLLAQVREQEYAGLRRLADHRLTEAE